MARNAKKTTAKSGDNAPAENEAPPPTTALTEEQIKAAAHEARDKMIADPDFREAVAKSMMADSAFRMEVAEKFEGEIRQKLEDELRPKIEAEIADAATKNMTERVGQSAAMNSRKKLIENLNALVPHMLNFGANSSVNLSRGEPKFDLREQIPGLVLNRAGHISVVSLLSSIGNWVFGARLMALGSPENLQGFGFKDREVVRKEYKAEPGASAQYEYLDGK